MRHLFISLSLILGGASVASPQDISAVEIQIEKLRAQLRDVVDREAQLQERVSKLDEDLKPESVERSVASVGTTDAAGLRARRRDELERQKADVSAQLSDASAKRARLEAEIAAAEAEAVRLKAAALAPKDVAPRNTPAAAPAAPAAAPAVQRKAPVRKSTPRKRKRPSRRSRRT